MSKNKTCLILSNDTFSKRQLKSMYNFDESHKLFDKKFVFLPETIKQENISVVPIIQKQGIWIK